MSKPPTQEKNGFLKQCLNVLKTEDVRNEIKIIFSPITDMILYEMYPYIYLIVFFVFLILVLILAILIILILTGRGGTTTNYFSTASIP
jgi:hypothetical protein